MRGAKKIDLKKIADAGCATAAQQGHSVEHVLVYANEDGQSQAETPVVAGRDVFWQEAIPQQPDTAGGWRGIRSSSSVAPCLPTLLHLPGPTCTHRFPPAMPYPAHRPAHLL